MSNARFLEVHVSQSKPDGQSPSQPAGQPGRSVAVVHNPIKVGSDFERRVRQAARAFGWDEPAFIPTSSEDPGHRMTAQALELQPDLVLAAGGDGTVRVVSTELRDSGVACGIIPMGTGNLLARNLGIPLELDEALETALTGRARPMDLARMIIDHENEVYFTGMAGVGFDAGLIRDTSEKLKKVVGTAAYVLSFAKQLGTPVRRLRVGIGDDLRLKRKAVLIMVGNTSSLAGGIELFPDAVPDDGKLDLILSSPRSIGGWARLFHAVLQRIRRSEAVEYWAAEQFVIELDEPTPWEVDGDSEGSGTHFEFSVLPGALQVITPEAGKAKQDA